MPLPTFIFYCGNIILLTAYLVLTALSLRAGGVSGVQQSRGMRWASAMFFFMAAVLHADMAIHTLTGNAFFDVDGDRVDWDFAIIVFVKMGVVVCGLTMVYGEAIRRIRSRHKLPKDDGR